MIHFLTTSTVCLVAFLGLYLLLLEKEKMHRFNRFYLLGAIVASFVIPFLSFEVLVERTVMLPAQPVSAMNNVATAVAIQQPSTNTVWLLPIIIYGIVSIALLIRFISSLRRFAVTVKNNPVQPYYNAQLVLVNQNVQPHTFGNSIFINRYDYQQGLIDEQLLQHELAHARQKHSADIVFIEMLLILFWFNPVLYFYKKAIQLNHEFLADEAVNSANKNVRVYQMLLLSKLAPAKGLYPASSLTFSLTKKRLIMMTKSTTPLMATLKKLAAAPVVAALVSLFCIETKIEPHEAAHAVAIAQPPPQEKNGPVTVDEYFAGVRFIAYEYGVQSKKEIKGRNVVIDKLYEDLTEADKKHFHPFLFVPKPYVKQSPTAAEFKGFMNAKKYAIWIDGKNVPNTELGKYKRTDIAHFSGSVILKNARTKKHPQPFQYWFYTHKGFDDAKLGVQKRHYGSDKIEVMSRIDKA